MARRTLLVGLAHPDDELACAGTIAAQVARGDRVILLWLTRGEMTEAFGPLAPAEVARIREAHGAQAAAILGCEVRFLDLPDTGVVAGPEAARRVARIICELAPDGLVTWGEAWGRGMRHPDHQACGTIFRDAVTLARIAKPVAPARPHRAAVPVFTLRGAHSALPVVAVDVEPYLERIHALGRFYLDEIGFGDPGWIARRLRAGGARHGLRYAELFDAWETLPGVVPSLLPATLSDEEPVHPDRELR